MSISRVGGQWAREQANAAAPAGPQGVAPGGVPTGDKDERFEVLSKYIPTETITMFVAVMSGFEAIKKLNPAVLSSKWPWVAYAAFGLLTPLLVAAVAYVTYRGEIKKANPPPNPIPAFVWPKFRMVAALLAFVIWALAVPGLTDNPAVQIVAGVGAVVVSTLLSLAEQVFE